MSPRAAELVAFLRSLRSERDIAGIRRFGIKPTGEHLGISVTRLRGIGKRNPRMRRAALAEADRILALGTKPARWIARDAIRELEAGARRK